LDWRDHIAEEIRGEARKDVPLASRISVRVGGPAALLVRPADIEDLATTLRLARDEGQSITILGGGANTVVGDGGIPGLTLKLPSGESETVEDLGDRIRLDLPGGAPSARLVQLAREHGLLGVEWAAGIPGTIGGMTAMNAGTRVGEMKDSLTEALLCGPEGAGWIPAQELHFRYRHAELRGRVVARIRCVLRKGSPAEVESSVAAMESDRAYRKRTQPLNLPNSGSVFRNPPGDHAGRLIESVGLKGSAEGGAQISPQHANFIVNRGGATARDVVTLMARAQQTVAEQHQIVLALEVRIVGLFVPSTEVLGLKVFPSDSAP
jgi:UDP-N-acetylmuramate dehydrogenase